MDIVVLDGYALNPGDLSWRGLEALGRLTVYDRSAANETIARARGAEILLTNKTPLSADHIGTLDDLRYISVLATGYNVVDIEAARARGVPVSNVPAYGTRSVAQMVFAHLLNLTNHVAHHADTVRQGRWYRSPDYCYWDVPLVALEGRVMGIVGLGRIGRTTAHMAQAFGMKVIASTRSEPDPALPGVERVTLDTLLHRSDVVSLHCPLTPETHHLMDAARLSLMKRSAYLINTSRGPLIDERALADALDEGRLAGAGLDVLGVEPPVAPNPLVGAKHCIVTPHIAWATQAARQRLMEITVDNLKAFLAGSPQHVVNGL